MTTTRTLATTAVLLSTAIAAFSNFGPEAALQLTSAHHARQLPLPSLADGKVGVEEGVTRWHALVRRKVLGQLLGLVLASASGSGEFLGAASIVGADVLFWSGGAGTYRYEVSSGDEESGAGAANATNDENAAATNSTTVCGSRVHRAPIPSSVSTALLRVNLLLFVTTLVGGLVGSGTPRRLIVRNVCAAIFCSGLLLQTLGDMTIRRKKQQRRLSSSLSALST